MCIDDMSKYRSLGEEYVPFIINEYRYWTLMREYEAALEKVTQPDFMNYSWLANFFHAHGGHGHIHFLPRYKNTRVFAGITFSDGRWGKNAWPSEPFKLEEQILFQLRDALRANI